MLALGEAPGFQTVQAELASRGELDAVGGAQFLVGLMQNVPTVAHAETYATIVERTALLRRLIGAANEIAHLALTREDAKSAVVDAQERVGTEAGRTSWAMGGLHTEPTADGARVRRSASS